MELLKQIVLLLLGIAIGVSLLLGFYKYKLTKTVSKEDATLLLQNIEKVCKLVTVEGNVSNILDHTDYVGFDVYPFRKKAILKVEVVLFCWQLNIRIAKTIRLIIFVSFFI